MTKRLNLAGKRFGRLVVLEYRGSNKYHDSIWLCKCDCGNTVTIRGFTLRLSNGATKSCGCLRRDIQRQAHLRHGHQRRGMETPTHFSWRAMMARCSNPRFHQFKDYGGRGILVCERWKQFENFLADMGERPHGLTLDRINNDGNYEPENCRWATRKQQNSNTRRSWRAA